MMGNRRRRRSELSKSQENSHTANGVNRFYENLLPRMQEIGLT